MENKSNNKQPISYSPELHKLDVFVGNWKSIGESYPEGNSNESLPSSSVDMTLIDTYEWILEDSFVVHHWDGHVADTAFKGMEVIGYDLEEKGYISNFFDNAGNAVKYQVTVNNNVFTYTGILQRATFEFSANGNTMKTHWDKKK